MFARNQFREKSAIVTGAASGIGRETAIAFARAGVKVCVADVDQTGLNETVKLIQQAEGNAFAMVVDVSNPDQVKEMVQTTADRFGGLDYAFNNAGTEGRLAPLADYEVKDWNKVIGINLTGVWLCMKYEIEQMLKTKTGVIVNNASILGSVGFAGASAYTASKHGVLGLTKTAALEYSAQGIRINSVCPGFIETPMLTRAGLMKDPAVVAAIAAKHAMNRMGKPEEIANVVLWLCSNEASFITGQPIYVDGGYTCQ